MRDWTIAQAGYLSYLQYWYSAEALQPSQLSKPATTRTIVWWDNPESGLVHEHWQRSDQGPWWWPSCLLGETPEFQPHSLGTYPWVICFLQMWSSETSTSAFLCVSPRNWKCTDDTKPPMSVMNQNWVCGSMRWTKPNRKKKKGAAEEESSTTVQMRKIFWQKSPPEMLLPLLLILKHSIHQVLYYLLQLENLIFQWENTICYEAVRTWLRNKHQMTMDGDKILFSAGSLGLFTANFSFTYILQCTFL